MRNIEINGASRAVRVSLEGKRLVLCGAGTSGEVPMEGPLRPGFVGLLRNSRKGSTSTAICVGGCDGCHGSGPR